MDTKNVTHKGNSLKASFVISHNGTYFSTNMSPVFLINGVVEFQVRQVTGLLRNTYNNILFVRFTKRCATDELNYSIQFTSAELKITRKTFITDDDTWYLIFEKKNPEQLLSFNVVVEMQLMPGVSSFASLHGDKDLTDFELRCEDGSVRMHRAVLAAESPVLRSMLCGEWREAAEGHVDITGISQTTLEHLKNYMYLHTVPNEGLEQLLLLSSYYMMPELERCCVNRLMCNATAENACELIEFAAEYNEKGLLLAILECVENGAIRTSEIRSHLNGREKRVSTHKNFLYRKGE